MLKAFVDDSRSFPPKPEVFVLGGYVASATRWATFSEEWKAALEEKPQIEYFKFEEAWNFSGQFLYWSEERRNAKMSRLYEVIEAHAEAEFAIALNPRVLREIYEERFGKKYWFAASPFYFCEIRLTIGLVRELEKLGLPRERVDFIFDNQVMEMDKILAEWQAMVALSKYIRPDPPDLRSMLLNPPNFADDKEVLPLQAADWQVGFMRVAFVNAINGQNTTVKPWKVNRPMPGLLIQYSSAQLREVIKDFNERFNPTAWAERVRKIDEEKG